MSDKNTNILTGNIKKTLFNLAIPIILSNFIQTMLGIVDMIWIGKLGSEHVSAIGTAGFYVNLATALTTLVCVGSGVKIAHSIGSKNEETRAYIKNGALLSFVISIIFVSVVFINVKELIGFFEMNNQFIENLSIDYLKASLVGIPFLFGITFLTTVLTSYGETKITFKANSIGLVTNIILDPLLIFGFSFLPAFGVVGAAWATNISRVIIFMILLSKSNTDMKKSIKEKIDLTKMMVVTKMSFPVTLQRVIFIYISMIMAKVIVRFGTDAIAVQKIGVQIESISYVTVGGLQGAISAFVGQNYGSGNISRIKDGFKTALKMVLVFGIIVSAIMIAFPKEIFGIFIEDVNVINGGIGYMRAIGVSQVFMCTELLTVGAFNGIGKTFVPPVVSITITLARIPLAIFLSSVMGLEGVWWSISITSILKGGVLLAWFVYIMKKEKGVLKHGL